MLDFYIVVPEDLVACAHQELQDISIRNMQSYFGITASAQEIMDTWANSD
jgi:hypothetical protein